MLHKIDDLVVDGETTTEVGINTLQQLKGLRACLIPTEFSAVPATMFSIEILIVWRFFLNSKSRRTKANLLPNSWSNFR